MHKESLRSLLPASCHLDVQTVYGIEQATIDNNNVLAVKYPQASFKSPKTGGLTFEATCLSDFLQTLTYSLYVPSDFDFVKGGKLPGLKVGSVTGLASGGRQEGVGETGCSIRLMWRKDGDAEVYAYIPLQSDEICNTPGNHCNTSFGISLMRGKSRLRKGEWNSIKLTVDLSAIGCSDGMIKLVVNGEEHSVHGLTIRNSPFIHVSGIFFSTFFGGGDVSWASPKDQSLSFRDFHLS